jgi:PAS domain S-box-containing protein
MQNVYGKLLEFTRDGVYRYTFEDGTILMANQGFVNILDLGCRPQEVIGRRLGDVMVYTEKEGTVRRLLEKSGELHGYEYHFRTLKGEEKCVLHDSFVMEDEATGRKVVEGIIKDITDRKRVERVLKESEEKYRNLVESGLDGICIIQDGRVAYANVPLTRMIGRRMEDIVGQPFSDFVDPSERDRVQHAYDALLGPAGRTARLDTALRRADGGALPTEISAGPITYNGQPAAMVLLHDLTERRRLEQALRESGRTEAVRSLAGGLGHNFGNLIGVIRGYAVAIQDNLIPNTKAHEYARRILDAADHAVHLGKRLMTFARADDATGGASLDAVSLDEVLRDTIEMVEHSFEQKSIRFEIPGAGHMPHVKADSCQLLDVLMNVLTNSAEAMPRGGLIAIDTIERRIPRPRLNPKAEGGIFVGLRIHDTGAGMSKAVARRAFEPFFTTKDTESSAGLGLTIAQITMQGMGGWMDLRAREGAGCTVRLFLPKALEEAKTAGPGEAAAPSADGRGILLVDDRLDELAVMRDALSREGYQVHIAADAKSGIATYRQNAGRIALTLMDLLIPKPGGRHVLEEILHSDPQANVIVISGFSRDYARGALPMGAWRFLQKPFTPQQLVSRVNSVLRGTVDTEAE